MRFELYVASRYLKAKRRQAVVGVVTAISIAGVAAGVAALIIALAITNGMRRDLQERLLGASAHVDLMRIQSDGIRDWQPLLEKLRRVPHVTAAAPGIYGQVLVSRGPRAGFALIKGIIPAQERTVSSLLETITSGSAKDLAPPAPQAPSQQNADTDSTQDSLPSAINTPYPPLVLGSDLAETIGAQVGDSVLVTSPQGELPPLGLAPKYQRIRVAGILYRAPEIARAIEQAAGKGYMTTNWMEVNRELFRALKLEQVVTFIVIALIVIVAALNILIALTMMVMEKTRDIAVMMSFGVQPAQVRRIFLLQGLLISLIGTVLGLVLGYLAAWAGGHYHFIHLSAEVYNIDTLPFAPRPLDGLIVSVVSIGISLLATLYPSSAAARILPAEALRYE